MQERNNGKSDSVVGVSGASLAFLSEAIGTGGILLVLRFPSLIDGVGCGRAVMVIRYHTRMTIATISTVEILPMVF